MQPGQHRARLEHIPANLITGRNGAAKSRLLQHLLTLRPAHERWAVLVTESDQATLPRDARPGVASQELHVASMTGGCICCSGSLELRTALTQLLRVARPQRVLIEAPASANTVELVRLLQDRWLAPVLDLRAIALVLEDGEAPGPPAGNGDDPLACVGIIVSDDPSAASAFLRLDQRRIAGRIPGDVALTREAQFDALMLDLPGPKVAPRFQSDDSSGLA